MSDLYSSIKQLEEEEKINKKGLTKKRKMNTENLISEVEEESKDKRSLPNAGFVFKCEEQGCSKTYLQKYRLLIHLRTHSGNKPYQCDICGKSFTEKGNMKVHLRVHTGIRPYACDMCNKAFKAYGQLKDHRKLHFDIRDYKCSLCNAEFNRKSTLKMHMLIHSDEKPFQCPHEGCDKTFREKSNMNKHTKVHMKKVQKIGSENITTSNTSSSNNTNEMTLLYMNTLFSQPAKILTSPGGNTGNMGNIGNSINYNYDFHILQENNYYTGKY